jgi:hypothetical protein
MYGEKRNMHTIVVGKPDGKRLPVRPRHQWEDDIKMDLKEIGWKGVDWIYVTQKYGQWWALVYTEMNVWIP